MRILFAARVFVKVNIQSALEPGDVHVWHVDLAASGDALAEAVAVLDAEEHERADRFAFADDRRRYVVAHAALRALLAAYLDRPAAALRFDRAPHGKPYLAGQRLRFNLSHSGERALVGLSTAEIGVDVQQICPRRDHRGLARRYFSDQEQAALAILPDELAVPGFYRCWTRKEAYMKATGAGLAMALDSFDVTVAPDAPPALLRAAGGEEEPARWAFAQLDPGSGYDAALAVEGPLGRLLERRLGPE